MIQYLAATRRNQQYDTKLRKKFRTERKNLHKTTEQTFLLFKRLCLSSSFFSFLFASWPTHIPSLSLSFFTFSSFMIIRWSDRSLYFCFPLICLCLSVDRLSFFTLEWLFAPDKASMTQGATTGLLGDSDASWRVLGMWHYVRIWQLSSQSCNFKDNPILLWIQVISLS